MLELCKIRNVLQVLPDPEYLKNQPEGKVWTWTCFQSCTWCSVDPRYRHLSDPSWFCEPWKPSDVSVRGCTQFWWDVTVRLLLPRIANVLFSSMNSFSTAEVQTRCPLLLCDGPLSSQVWALWLLPEFLISCSWKSDLNCFDAFQVSLVIFSCSVKWLVTDMTVLSANSRIFAHQIRQSSTLNSTDGETRAVVSQLLRRGRQRCWSQVFIRHIVDIITARAVTLRHAKPNQADSRSARV